MCRHVHQAVVRTLTRTQHTTCAFIHCAARVSCGWSHGCLVILLAAGPGLRSLVWYATHREAALIRLGSSTKRRNDANSTRLLVLKRLSAFWVWCMRWVWARVVADVVISTFHQRPPLLRAACQSKQDIFGRARAAVRPIGRPGGPRLVARWYGGPVKEARSNPQFGAVCIYATTHSPSEPGVPAAFDGPGQGWQGPTAPGPPGPGPA